VDGSGGLRDVLEVVSLEDDLVLLGLGLGDGDTLEHGDLSDDLLSCKNATQKDEERQRTRARARGEEKEGTEEERTQEVSDGDRVSSLTNDAVDGEMGVDGSHLVLESLCDAKTKVESEGRGGEGELRANEGREGRKDERRTNLGDSNDHVLDQRSDGSKASDVLSSSVPDRQGDGVGLLDLEEGRRKEGKKNEGELSLSFFARRLFHPSIPILQPPQTPRVEREERCCYSRAGCPC